MLNIDKLSKYIAKKITKEKDKQYEGHYSYAIEGLITFFLYSTISITLAIVFGYFPQIIFIMFIFLKLRKYAGGYHALKAEICCATTLSTYFIIGISTVMLNNWYWSIFTLSLISFLGLERIPVYTKKAIKHKEEKQKIFKKKYIIMLSGLHLINLIMVVITILGICDLSSWSIAISGSILFVQLLLSEFSFKVFDKFK